MPTSGGFINVDVRLGNNARLDDILERSERPFAGATGVAIAAAMRQGPGSTGDQFAQEREVSFTGGRTWPKTKPFGRRPAPARTLVRTGALESAWTGSGAGATTRLGPRTVAIGVDPRVFPQAVVFQSLHGAVVRAKRKGARGLPRMYWFLGMEYGVWVDPWKLASQGFHIPPRAVSLNAQVMARVQSAVIEGLTGRAPQSRPTPAAVAA